MRTAELIKNIHYAPAVLRPVAMNDELQWQVVSDFKGEFTDCVYVTPQKVIEGDLSPITSQIANPAYHPTPPLTKAMMLESIQQNSTSLCEQICAEYEDVKKKTLEQLQSEDGSKASRYHPPAPSRVSAFAMTSVLLTDRNEAIKRSADIKKHVARSISGLDARWLKAVEAANVQFVVMDQLQANAGYGAMVPDTPNVNTIMMDASIVPMPSYDDVVCDKKVKKFQSVMKEEIIHIVDIRSGFSERADIKAALSAFRERGLYDFCSSLQVHGITESREHETVAYIAQPKELLAMAVLYKDALTASELARAQKDRGTFSRLTRSVDMGTIKKTVDGYMTKTMGEDMVRVVEAFEQEMNGHAQGAAKHVKKR
jgi:hypothetical protein